MKIEFELLKEVDWCLVSKDNEGSALSYFTSRRKALLSIVRRIELIKPSKHFMIILEDIEDGS